MVACLNIVFEYISYPENSKQLLKKVPIVADKCCAVWYDNGSGIHAITIQEEIEG